MKRHVITCLGVALALSWGCVRSQPQIGLEVFATGFTRPVAIANAGDNRLFVVEQEGIIRIVDSSGEVMARPFLDIHGRVKSSGNEQGLLGLAFHPGYDGNGYLYVNYTGVGDSTHISRFSVSAADPDSAVPSSEFTILKIYQPFQNHNGGDLRFGPDGYLYIAMGDGGSAGDPGNRAQDLSQLLGKILRIDINNGNPYEIPPDNPFLQDPQARDEIWALGLRNPWRFSFDRATGDMWIADVGQGAFEEVDFQPASSTGGENYGWRCYEGNAPYNTSGCLPPQLYVFPVHEYPHDATQCWSITGGYVYRGVKYPGLAGLYFFAEYCKDTIWALSDSGGAWHVALRGHFPGNNFSTFGENYQGELFVAGLASGTIFRILDAGTSGYGENRGGKRARITPNPFSDRVWVTIASEVLRPAVVVIRDISGRTVLRTTVSEKVSCLNTQTLNRGVYFLNVEFRANHENNETITLLKH